MPNDGIAPDAPAFTLELAELARVVGSMCGQVASFLAGSETVFLETGGALERLRSQVLSLVSTAAAVVAAGAVPSIPAVPANRAIPASWCCSAVFRGGSWDRRGAKLDQGLRSIPANLQARSAAAGELADQTCRLGEQPQGGSLLQGVERGVAQALSTLREQLAQEAEIERAMDRVLVTITEI
jgi:hypothetical protein